MYSSNFYFVEAQLMEPIGVRGCFDSRSVPKSWSSPTKRAINLPRPYYSNRIGLPDLLSSSLSQFELRSSSSFGTLIPDQVIEETSCFRRASSPLVLLFPAFP